ncbi:hypothetical protein PVAG01_01051 [Phlyctema vagabunda]|uniref:Transmembrane protein n=1 Tax=Phlyctema vagabunda TaxID=108571 RepID=A0ABR4PW11_9HELO
MLLAVRMLTLLPTHFVQQEVTRQDYLIASLAWGFTLGFGFLTTWTAVKQTLQVGKRYGTSRLNSPYVWMIWMEITVCLSFSIICWLYIIGQIAPSFAFYFCILTLWALQVQFLLQIIINRVAILLVNRDTGRYLKIGVAVLITIINISVYCIWVPARLQINDSYIHINEVWDRCEKGIYLIVDALLNIYFIHIVRKRLVRQGLSKYEPLVKFNVYIIGFSLSMDVLIIGMMSLRNTFVYMQFHPLAYIVKLKIEMSMADLIAKVAREPHAKTTTSGGRAILGSHDKPEAIKPMNKFGIHETNDDDGHEWYSNSKDIGDIQHDNAMELKHMHNTRDLQVHTKHDVSVTVEKYPNDGDESFASSQVAMEATPRSQDGEEDTRPLRQHERAAGASSQTGFTTKVWAPHQ